MNVATRPRRFEYASPRLSHRRMPTYEFRCPDGHDFERFFRKISDASSEFLCPTCGKIATRQISAGGGLLFKGSGFYLTDYGKNAHREAPAAVSGDGAKAESGKAESGIAESGKSESGKLESTTSKSGASEGGKSERGKSGSRSSESGSAAPKPESRAPAEPKTASTPPAKGKGES